MQENPVSKLDEDKLEDFLVLTSDRALADLQRNSSLYEGDLPKDLEPLRAALASLQRSHNYWQAVTTHQVVKLLDADERFRAARERFKKKFIQTKAGRRADPFAEIRFLHVVARTIGSYIVFAQSGPARKPINARAAQQALGHAQKLTKFLDNGFRLRDVQADRSLRKCLDDLVLELHTRQPAKPGPSKTRAQQGLVRWLIRSMFDNFGAADQKIVEELSAMVSYEPDRTTIARLIRTEKAGFLRRGSSSRT